MNVGGISDEERGYNIGYDRIHSIRASGVERDGEISNSSPSTVNGEGNHP